MTDKQLPDIFADCLITHHAELLEGDDKTIRDAVIVKIVALLALGFDIPPVDGQPVDMEESIQKLRAALITLQGKH